MKKIFFPLLILVSNLFCINAQEEIDSLSYAYGYLQTIDGIKEEKNLLKNKDDFQEYIRGLEDNKKKLSLGQTQESNDSSYMISYLLGGMEGVFIADGVRSKSGEPFPFSCIIEGLHKVERNDVKLPADTIAAHSFIDKIVKENPDPENLDEETNCKFFTSYGVMKAYQPGLQEYIEGIMPGTKCKENRQAFAAGMADIMETIIKKPDTSYDLGRLMATELFLSSLQTTNRIDFDSYFTGAKAAMGLGEEIIPRDSVETFFERYNLDKNKEYDKKYDSLEELIGKLYVSLGAYYLVNWNMTAARVAKETSPAFPAFNSVIDKYESIERSFNGFLMVQLADENVKLYEDLIDKIKDTPLPNGFKWFSGGRDNSLFIGIMETSHLFEAEVHRAIVEADVENGIINVSWSFDGDDVKKWADFTASNIEQHVAVEINGNFIFAPKVNCQINGGNCSASGLSAEEINRLFKNAKPTFETQQE